MRYFIQLSYFGKHFHGWQYQPNARSVQEELDRALSVVFNTPIKVMGAGRTDTGVHAKEMWGHFEFSGSLPENLIFRLNRVLDKDVVLHQVKPVKDRSHARFDALSRSYEYHFGFHKNPFLQDLSWEYPYPLNVEKMQAAAKILLEYEDFTSFCKSKVITHTKLCKIEQARIVETKDGLVFEISANRFLRNMVRAIVGTLVSIGSGKQEVNEMHEIIRAKNRRFAGKSAPAHGLYLSKVIYPNTIFDVE